MSKTRITTSGAPAALGPYSQAIDTGGLVFCAGQVGLDPATGAMVEGGIEAQTERALTNLGSVLEAAGLGYARRRQDALLPDRHGRLPGVQRRLRPVLPGAVPGPLDRRGEGHGGRVRGRDRGHRGPVRGLTPAPRRSPRPWSTDTARSS